MNWAAIALVLAVLIFGRASADTAYSREAEFWAVSFSEAQFVELMTKVSEFLKSANRDHTLILVELELSDGTVANKVRGEMSYEKLKIGLPVVYRARFSYQVDRTAPVSSVVIDFGDVRRQVSVEGTSPTQSSALMALLSQEVSRQQTFGGAGPRIVAFVILGSLGTLLGASTLYVRGVSVFPGPWSRVGLVVGFWMLAGAMLVQPLGPWFPGTAIYSGDASWWTRHNVAITVVLALLPMLPGMASWLRKRLGQRRTQRG